MSTRRVFGAALFACVALSLLAGIAGGLARIGVLVADTEWLPRAALAHAALMIGGFMATVIGIERAVAVKHSLAWLAPIASGVAGAALLAGSAQTAAALFVLASGVFVAANALILVRQRAPHTVLLLASALAWAAGNVLYAGGADTGAVLPWWFTFLVATVAAERLEMTRLMRRRPGASLSLWIVLAALTAGAACSAWSPRAGGTVFGAALVALALWLFAFDIARRTVRAQGLPRYMAVCLLAGYAWLAIGGLAWIATAWSWPGRDAALHALGLGFLASMILGHAPVILPAIARIKLRFGPFFYLPLAALHASLAWRLAAGLFDLHFRVQGAVGNVLALALFAATVAGAALAWRHSP